MLFKVAPPFVNRLPLPVVSPPLAVVKPVTPRVPPMVALLVTCKAVPAELKVLTPVKVLAPDKEAKPQAELLCKQTVPLASGSKIELVPVGAVAVKVVELAPLNDLRLVASAERNA